MRYRVDHDYHIHSQLSFCSNDPGQTNERILQYAKENGLSRICLTNHYWDSAVPGASEWYQLQNFDHLYQAQPLPQAENIQFMFGCETDMDKYLTIGIPEERFKDFSFIIISTTHLHMTGFTIAKEDAESNEKRARLWVKRLEHVLDMPLPFGKIGISHLASSLINRKSREDYLETLSHIPDTEMERVFVKAAQVGCGIELNQVKFRYNNDMPYVLDGLELDIKPGEYLGITGSSGCGKSTLMRILLGFEKAQSGSVYYDKQNLTEPFQIPAKFSST